MKDFLRRALGLVVGVWIEETDPATAGYIPFRFTSKELDEETGLYYYGARYYEPTNSRWMSADPAGFALINPMGSLRPATLLSKLLTGMPM